MRLSTRPGRERAPRLSRPSTHGEYLHYTRGCRCDECKAGNAAYVRELRARKAAELNLAA